jgi:hypothetical protein
MTQDARDHRFLGNGGHEAEYTAPAKGTGGHSQVKHAPQQSCPAPVRCPRVGLMPIHTLLARCRRDRAAQTAVWRQTASIPHEMDAWQHYQRRQILQEFQRQEGNASRPVRPWFCERVHEAPMGSFLQTFQCHGASRRVPNQAFWRWGLLGYAPVDTGAKIPPTSLPGALACASFPAAPIPSGYRDQWGKHASDTKGRYREGCRCHHRQAALAYPRRGTLYTL